MQQSAAPFFCLGADHMTTPLWMLEKLSVAGEKSDGFSRTLHERLGRIVPGGETLLLATCNRFEIYWTEGSYAEVYRSFGGCRGANGGAGASASAGNGSAFLADLRDLLSEDASLPGDVLFSHLTLREGRAAIEHLYRVACGLESLVIGEHQILGQVEDAVDASSSAKTAGPVLETVFSAAVRCGRRARNETDIARNPRSVSTVAVQFAESVLGEIGSRRVLIAGSGDMGRLTLKALHHRGARSIAIVNRRLEGAQQLAEGWGASAHAMTELESLLAETDLFIASTSSPEPILAAAEVKRAMVRRSSRPLVIIDLAVPRDVDAEVGSLPGVHLFDLESLKSIADAGECESRKAIPSVERIICGELDALRTDLGTLAVRPVLADLWKFGEEVRDEVMRGAHASMGELDGEQWGQIERMTRLLTNKLLHRPSALLRREASNGKAVEYARAVAELFDLFERSDDGGQDQTP